MEMYFLIYSTKSSFLLSQKTPDISKQQSMMFTHIHHLLQTAGISFLNFSTEGDSGGVLLTTCLTTPAPSKTDKDWDPDVTKLALSLYRLPIFRVTIFSCHCQVAQCPLKKTITVTQSNIVPCRKYKHNRNLNNMLCSYASTYMVIIQAKPTKSMGRNLQNHNSLKHSPWHICCSLNETICSLQELLPEIRLFSSINNHFQHY